MTVARRLRTGLAAAAVLLAALHAAPAAASDLLARCWPHGVAPPAAGEGKPVRGVRHADPATPNQALARFSPVPAGMRGAIRRVEIAGPRKLIALTFDLCETAGEIAGYDSGIVDYLRTNGVRATFFAGGKWLLTHPERALQLMADARFEVGSHGWAHRNMRLLTGAALAEEINGPQAAYEALRARLGARQCAAAAPEAFARLPPRIGLFRFPFGACNPAALAAVADAGLLAVQWDVSTADPSPGQSAQAIAAAMVRQARPGSIILLHANGRGYNTAAALPIAIPKLKAMGFELVTVSELMAAGRPVIVPSCYDSRPGDTDRYDFLFRARAPAPRPAPGKAP